MRRLTLVLAAAVLAYLALPFVRPAAERAWFMWTLATEAPAERLPLPVGAKRRPHLIDSWGSPRAGGRRHEGIDIFAPKGSPVLSTTRGVITRIGTNALGGQIVGVLGPGLEFHYYAHLDRFGVFHEGDLVHVGDVLGYVGNSGDARGTPPHLHYGIYRHSAENPYPRLTRRL